MSESRHPECLRCQRAVTGSLNPCVTCGGYFAPLEPEPEPEPEPAPTASFAAVSEATHVALVELAECVKYAELLGKRFAVLEQQARDTTDALLTLRRALDLLKH